MTCNAEVPYRFFEPENVVGGVGIMTNGAFSCCGRTVPILLAHPFVFAIHMTTET